MPPGRPRFDLDPFKAEIVEAWDRRETIESMIKSLDAKGVQVNIKTFQRRLKEWGLYRYHKTPKRQNVRPSSGSTPGSPAPVAASITQPPVLLPITQEIPDSLREESNSLPSSSPMTGFPPATPRRDTAFSNSYTQAASINTLPPLPPPPKTAPKVWTRRNPAGYGLEKSLEAIRNPGAAPVPVPMPSFDIEALEKDGDSFTLDSFNAEDAYELGHLLHARLLPYSLVEKRPTVVSISLANAGSHVLFQTAVGSGTLPDTASWVDRKRNSVLRWHCSTWLLHNKFKSDERAFAACYSMSPDQASNYTIHGGGVPIRVNGVEGIVAVVVVCGLKHDQDHSVIADVIRENWRRPPHE